MRQYNPISRLDRFNGLEICTDAPRQCDNPELNFARIRTLGRSIAGESYNDFEARTTFKYRIPAQMVHKYPVILK